MNVSAGIYLGLAIGWTIGSLIVARKRPNNRVLGLMIMFAVFDTIMGVLFLTGVLS